MNEVVRQECVCSIKAVLAGSHSAAENATRRMGWGLKACCVKATESRATSPSTIAHWEDGSRGSLIGTRDFLALEADDFIAC